MNLSDIAPLARWVELEKDIHRKSGMDVNVFNPEGYRISEFKIWANQLCPQIKATDKGQSFICAPAHMNIAAQAMRSKQAAIEACDAGMIKLVVPIFIGEEFVGTVGACGFLLDDGEVDGFLIYKMTGIEEDIVERLSQGIPSITTKKAESLSLYISEQIGKIMNSPRSQEPEV
jgi:ligand-binding sensor protein